MKRIFAAILLASLGLSAAAFAQNGVVFPTQGGVQLVPGMALMVPSNTITNGQPAYAPPGLANPLAVNCVTCSPSAPVTVTSTPVSGTIGTTNLFQDLMDLNPARRGCLIQNNGAHTMYFSIQASPTLAGSNQVPPGWAYTCSQQSNIVIGDKVWITGTAGDAFAGQWQ